MDKLHLLPDKPSFIWCFSPEMTPPHFAASADWHWAGSSTPSEGCLSSPGFNTPLSLSVNTVQPHKH